MRDHHDGLIQLWWCSPEHICISNCRIIYKLLQCVFCGNIYFEYLQYTLFWMSTDWQEGPYQSEVIILFFGHALVPQKFLRICRVLMFLVIGATYIIIFLRSLRKSFWGYASEFEPNIVNTNIYIFFLVSLLCSKLWNKYFQLFEIIIVSNYIYIIFYRIEHYSAST